MVRSQYQTGITGPVLGEPRSNPRLRAADRTGQLAQYQTGIDSASLAGYAGGMPRTRSSVLIDHAEASRRLGSRLAAAREKAGLSQLAAAKAIGVPQSVIGKLERGRRQLHFLEALRLAALYGVDCRDIDPDGAEDLFGDDGP